MNKTYAYMRISTKEERGLQKYNRQEKDIAKWCKENGVEIPERRTFKDDASGKSFDRPQWQALEEDVEAGDTIIFKDICRFTRECRNGLAKYNELVNRGVTLIFIDNPMVSTDYIKSMVNVAENNVITEVTMESMAKILLTVELDRAEKERETTVKRIKDGIAASDKKSGREKGHLDKMTDELREDIKKYLGDRSIKAIDLMKKHGVSRNTFKKYTTIVESEMKAE